MKAIDRKLWRDLWKMKGQAFAIVLIIVSGVTTFVMLISTMNSLNETRDRFYLEYGFAEIFSSLKRAPESLRTRISEIPGVEQVETRVVADVKLEIPGFDEPATGRLVSVPDHGQPLLNRLYIRKGRSVDPLREDEVVVSEAFAEAHKMWPGDRFGAVINGRWKTLVVVGIALSPEFVLQVRPGALSPDFKRYAVLWMGREALGTAYDMEGAFNDVVLTLSPRAKTNEVLNQLDDLLGRYGGLGSYERRDQMSHRFLTEEFRQLERSSKVFPLIFVGVATFLLNVVINRTIQTQREQIAILKAFGYSHLDIWLHYVKMVLMIVLIGVAGGIGVGVWFGKGLGNIYMEFYRFPYLIYELQWEVVLTAVLINMGSALVGTFHSLRKASMLPPAEAMRPEPPARYRKTVIEYLRLWHLLSQPARMIFRNIERRPIKSSLSIAGIALACAILIAAIFWKDAVDFMVEVQFKLSQKEDLAVTFVEPTSRKAIYELSGLKGVQYAEPFRSVPAKFRFEHRSYRTAIRGVEPGAQLHSLLDMNLKPVELPPEGIVLTDYLGTLLGIQPGDMLTVEVLEGERPVRQVPVAGFINQYIGVMGYMDVNALRVLMREGEAISGANLMVDPLYQADLYKKLVQMPRVAGTVVRKDEIKNFYETQAEAFLFFTFIATILASTIAFGVVYNSARITLSERSRELASLRVLGYTRAEISYILLGELGLFTLVAIPIGLAGGRLICTYLAATMGSDLFRIPVVVDPATYSLSAAVVVVSAFLSGLIVRHRLDHLDLVAVLKTKE